MNPAPDLYRCETCAEISPAEDLLISSEWNPDARRRLEYLVCGCGGDVYLVCEHGIEWAEECEECQQ